MQLIKALACQALAIIITILLAKIVPQYMHGLVLVLSLQGIVAALFSSMTHQPVWWIPIHLLFLPLAFGLLNANLPAWIYLTIWLVLMLIFWGTVKGDVPLYLSSDAVTRAIIKLVEQENVGNFCELGAGIGTVVVPLAKNLSTLRIEAVERAPLPLIIMKLRCWLLHNVTVQNKNLWDCDLGDFDLVFTFLSPLFMEQIGEKVKKEMRSGSLFVSSSFIVPDWQPESVIELQDARGTLLFCYRV
ncbi:MAG: hypothetical protein ABL919_14830 [Methylococcales bacterium]|nr:hypothetical protein [Methylococcaceae bacterium]